MKVTELGLQHFILSPGKGGQPTGFFGGRGFYFAFKTFECWMPKLTGFIEGGGGGVLVDGEGPGQEDQYQVLGSFISNTIKQS